MGVAWLRIFRILMMNMIMMIGRGVAVSRVAWIVVMMVGRISRGIMWRMWVMSRVMVVVVGVVARVVMWIMRRRWWSSCGRSGCGWSG